MTIFDDEAKKDAAKAMARANLPTNGMFNPEQLEEMFEQNWPKYLPLVDAALTAALASLEARGRVREIG
jgi:hypothetical protein